MMRILKWIGIGAAVLLGIVLIALVAIYGLSERRFRRSYDVQPRPLAIQADSATLTRGQHIAVIRGCTDCHGESLGGRLFIDAPPMARLYASNLTPGRGGVGRSYTAVDWDRAIRHGVGPDGRPLLFMPSHEFQHLSNEDAAALIVYLQALSPVDNEMPNSSIGPLGRVLFLTGQMPLVPAELIEHDAPRRETVVAGITPEYGAYLAISCQGCHGAGLSGGPWGPPDAPPAANLTMHETGLKSWTEADFMRALRTGRRPDGTELSEMMPWRATAQMTDEEIRAIWAYLQSVEPKPEGNN